jgi:hypothetical protein
MAGKPRQTRPKNAKVKALPVPSVSLDALIRRQGAKPVTDFDALSAKWPAEHDPDAFAKFVREERAARRAAKPRRKTA